MADSTYKLPSTGPKVPPKMQDEGMAGVEVSNRGYPGGRNMTDLIGAETVAGPSSFMGPEDSPTSEISKSPDKGSQGTNRKLPA